MTNAHAKPLDTEGLHVDRPGTISTWHGRIDPLHPDPAEVDILDIAHSLARLCRYNGHVGGFLSVARHSMWVAGHLMAQGHDTQTVLQGLLHDGAEAYLSDIPRPIKRAPELANFREIDAAMDEAVMTAFGLPFPIPEVVMDADRYVLLNVEMAHPDGARFHWLSTPEEDEEEFIRMYHALTDTIAGSPDSIPVFGATAPQVTRLVGLSGYAQSGKDTAARVLMEHFGFQRIAFADKLRDVLYALNPVVEWVDRAPMGWNRPQYDRDSVQDVVDRKGWERAKQEHPAIRELLQRLGTEAGRKVLGESVWVDAAMSQVVPGGRYVFTDVRFPNEYDAIKAAGGEVWRIERAGTAAVNRHPSETALDGFVFDRVVYNSAGLLEFDRKIHVCAAGLFRR